MPALDPHAVLRAVALVFIVMAGTLWMTLSRRRQRRTVALWCLGGACCGAAMFLFGLRPVAPAWLSVQGASAVSLAGFALQATALRLERGQRPRWAWAIALAATGAVAVAAAGDWPEARRNALALALNAAAASIVGWLSWRVAAQLRSRGAAQITAASALLAATAAWQAARLAPDGVNVQAGGSEVDVVVAVTAALVSGVLANLGYLGVALDRARAADRAHRDAFERSRDEQVALELASRTRKAVARERARTTRLLAHEVRQPLHNAAVALQAAVATLARSRDAEEASRAIEQAQNVIQRVAATLDNTVAAATLLAGEGQLTTYETDLDMLVRLCVTDLPPESRHRIEVEHLADARSAQMEVGLVRLAVRNLLINATLYSPADSPVTLRLLDSDDPLALVIEVADHGPGLPPDEADKVFEPGVRGSTQASIPGHGLGLHVVRQVAQLHGGRVEWRPNQPCGSVFRLTIPQGDPG